MYRISEFLGGGENAVIAGFMREQSVIPYQTLYWTRLVQHWRTKRLKLGPRTTIYTSAASKRFFTSAVSQCLSALSIVIISPHRFVTVVSVVSLTAATAVAHFRRFSPPCLFFLSLSQLALTSYSKYCTVWLKWIARICSRYATPPPLWEQFTSSFRFQHFSHWNTEIWKMSKKEWKQLTTRFTPTKFAHFWAVLVI